MPIVRSNPWTKLNSPVNYGSGVGRGRSTVSTISTNGTGGTTNYGGTTDPGVWNKPKPVRPVEPNQNDYSYENHDQYDIAMDAWDEAMDQYDDELSNWEDEQKYNMGATHDYGRPDIQEYAKGFDPTADAITNYMAENLGNINLNKQGLEKFRGEALRTGPSAWARMAEGKQRAEESQARESGIRQGAGQRAGAFSALASRGGLDSGARERLARSGMRDTLDMGQDIRRQGALNRMQIGMNDETNRIQQLGMLPGMEIAALQPEMDKAKMMQQSSMFDMTNKINEAKQFNDYNMAKYQELQKGYAAEQAANAQKYTANKENDGTWLCTEAKPMLRARDWAMLGKLKKYALEKHPESTEFYVKKCQPLVDRMKQQGADWAENVAFAKKISGMVAKGMLEEAHELYYNTVDALLEKYWPESAEIRGGV